MFGNGELRERIALVEKQANTIESDKYKIDAEIKSIKADIESIKTSLSTLLGLVNAQQKAQEKAEAIENKRKAELFGGLSFGEALKELITGIEVNSSNE